MPYTQTPSKDPQTSPDPPREHPDLYDARHWETAYRHFDEDAVPTILLFLQDDLTRSRRREAAWLSVVVHLLFILLLVYVPKRPVGALALTDPLKDKDLDVSGVATRPAEGDEASEHEHCVRQRSDCDLEDAADRPQRAAKNHRAGAAGSSGATASTSTAGATAGSFASTESGNAGATATCATAASAE